jgi:hypothetical protein
VSSEPPASAAQAAPRSTGAVPAGGVRFVATPFKGLATVKEHLAVNLINTDAVLTSNGVDGVLTLKGDGTFARFEDRRRHDPAAKRSVAARSVDREAAGSRDSGRLGVR